ncbi:class I SAM-dependent methyltransferase [Nocardiopsis nanhaiensis]
MATEYLLDSGTDLGEKQLTHLSALLDGLSGGFIETVAAREGQRCLDLGSGNGSMARWIAERTGPSGEVHAVDIDLTHLHAPDPVRVHRHDVNEGLPESGPFDVIHTRLLLMHLKRRRDILAELVDALAPGGWLVVGDFTRPPTDPVSAPSPTDAELFHRVVSTGIDQVARPAGQDYAWGHRVDSEMIAAGLTNVDTMGYTSTAYGGSTGCLLYSVYLSQIDAPLRAKGLTGDELRRFHELMLDPRMRIWFFPFLCTRGQKPPNP